MQGGAIESFWARYLATLAPDHPHPAAHYTAWPFGDNPALADELGELVRAGIKTATASLMWEYEAEGHAPPSVGEISIILDGAGAPLCIIETTRLYIAPFDEVDAEQAYEEGEGDRSLAYWREAHWHYFGRVCTGIGRVADPQMPVLCERFRLLYRP